MAVSIQTGAEPIPGYTLHDRLGSGGFGEVWKCEAPGGIFKAIKIIHGDLRYQDTDSFRFAEQELKSLKRVKSVRHPYLLALDRYDIVEGKLMIVMELADCNLWDRYRECRGLGHSGIPRDELLQYMSESAEVLDLMNDKHQLQHLDIKPQNLFMLYNHVKVADFGQVKDLEHHVAQVTGGITPVYAAPETFDGFVSRYCDQYSLACVYQELLTGIRPFDGTSMNQLLMQHLSQPPNLQSSPPNDRLALQKALSKKPEDRFDSVGEFVKSIRSGSAPSISLPVAPPPSSSSEAFVPIPRAPDLHASHGDAALAYTPPPRSASETAVPPERQAPPEKTGPGPLRPTLVIGLGFTGQRLIQRFRKVLAGRYGVDTRMPSIRTLYIDTDPDAVAASAVNPSHGGWSGIPPEASLAAPLNRSAHYLRPRNNGRALTEGWFDTNVLYRLPRNPVTTGLRSLGRLAFCDHYRSILQRIQTELDLALDPIASAITANATGQELGSNRPRVYIAAGLGGGTGSGMIFDLAYAIRHRLQRIGYAHPDLVGLLFAPPADGATTPQARSNTFAALTELHHFSHFETEYSATFDDSVGGIRESSPPFLRTVILRGFESSTESASPSQTSFPTRRKRSGGSSTTTQRESNRTPGGIAGDPTASAAEFLRLECLTPQTLANHQSRLGFLLPESVHFGTFGLRRYGWPRQAVVARTARVIAPVLLGHWVEPDPTQVRRVVPRWAAEQLKRLGLDGNSLLSRLTQAADRMAGTSVAGLIRDAIEPLLPKKGWKGRLPESPVVARSLERIAQLFNPPRAGSQRVPTNLEEAVAGEAKAAARKVAEELMAMIPALLDTPAFRLVGTEEAIREWLVALEATRVALAEPIAGWEKAAGVAFDRLTNFAFSGKSGWKPTAVEFTEAWNDYPKRWFDSILSKHALEILGHLQEVLVERRAELAACRARLQERHRQLIVEAEQPAIVSASEEFLPVGCPSIEDSAQRFLKILNDDDLNELEQRVQLEIASEMGGVYECCLNSAEGPEAMLRILRTVARKYLDERLGEVDFFGMMKQKYGSSAGVGEALAQGLEEAEPNGIANGPWSANEICTFAAPLGAGGVPIVQQATAILPPTAQLCESTDEVVIYREWPVVPLAALDQLGPAWEAAYKNAPDSQQTSPHTRTDITRWQHVDG